MEDTQSQAPVGRALFDEVMVPNYAPAEIIPVRGQGSVLWDQQGRDYVDLAGGIAVTCLGHCHPHLVTALTDQGNRLWHLSNVMTNEPALRLAKRLCERTFAEKVFFANSGGEANEAALKLARRYAADHFGAEKREIISFYQSFHGRTLFTVSVGGQAKYTEGFEPLPGGITHLPFNDLEALRKAISSERTCAVIMEPVQGEGGILPADPEFVRGVRELCDAHHALLIFDEVQTGFGRTGHLYAYQDMGVTPDILTSAKGLGGGFPIGAMLTTTRIAASLVLGTHGSTYGGNPLACAVAGAVLDVLDDPAVLLGVAERHDRLVNGLRAINERTPVFAEVRGKGLLVGAVLAEGWKGRARDIIRAGQAAGVMVLMAGPDVLRLAPSLVIPDDVLDQGIERLGKAIAQLAAA